MKKSSILHSEDYIKVSTFSSKLVIWALAFLALGLLAWCFGGVVTDKENIKGVIFPFDGSANVSIPNDGTVKEIFVHKGDMVQKGQTLALVSIAGSYSIISAPYEGEILSFIPENQSFNAFEDIFHILTDETSSNVLTIFAYADFNSSRLFHEGQEVQITPSFETRERVGFVKGKIVSVSSYPVSKEETISKLQNASMVDEVFPTSPSVFEISITMDTKANDPTQLDWSFNQKEPINMSVGTYCDIEVIVKSRSIFKYLLENVQEARNTTKLWRKR